MSVYLIAWVVCDPDRFAPCVMFSPARLVTHARVGHKSALE